ncbi:uncharacterized protein LOC131687071 [Topomyia yanbarensis]|uniref:uncharacterized protein LOC131687071 n=1 Tax=Topomyia yanbarensis TaxID=2498891 RepID=UPI00273B4036|nr:uncharacterized protein LOC131687071 [Topomyia yanbarensis]
MKSFRYSQKNKILKIVEEVRNGEGCKFRCIAADDEDRKCAYVQTVFNAGNFKRHVVTHHAEVARRLGLEYSPEKNQTEVTSKPTAGEPPAKKMKQKLLVETTKKNIFLGTLQLATSFNLPLRYPDWQGMKLLAGPLWDAAGIRMNKHVMQQLIRRAAELMRSILKAEMNSKIVNLKIDSASRRSRSVFGVNVQFMDEEDRVQIRHLAVQEMIQRQTKENLKIVMEEVMLVYGLSSNQLLTIAHDNGANMCAAVKLLKLTMENNSKYTSEPLSTMLPQESNILKSAIDGSFTAEKESDDERTLSDEDEGDWNDENLQDIGDAFDNEQEGTINYNFDQSADEENSVDLGVLNSVRCGAHTAQLAVWDVVRLVRFSANYCRCVDSNSMQMFNGDIHHMTALDDSFTCLDEECYPSQKAVSATVYAKQQTQKNGKPTAHSARYV